MQHRIDMIRYAYKSNFVGFQNSFDGNCRVTPDYDLMLCCKILIKTFRAILYSKYCLHHPFTVKQEHTQAMT